MPPLIKPKSKTTSLWEGPSGEGPNGGVTQSLISSWLGDVERFYIGYCLGLRPSPTFEKAIEFGQLMHLAIETYCADGRNLSTYRWKDEIQKYARKLCEKYPTQQEEIDKWYNVALVTFPLYAKFWEEHPSMAKSTSLLQEQVFDVPYALPSGRTVRLRGKWDEIELRGEGKDARIWLSDTKTKGEILGYEIQQRLEFDLQTLLYLIALKIWQGLDDYGTPIRTPQLVDNPIAGVLYNVILRPLSGGTGSIRQHKPTKKNPLGESKASYFKRLHDIIRDSPEQFFHRWEAYITTEDIDNFRKKCLDPILEQMILWYNVKVLGKEPYALPDYAIHYLRPHGLTNWLDRSGSSDYDKYIWDRVDSGLVKATKLFGELNNES